jgi:hypothetical protein
VTINYREALANMRLRRLGADAVTAKYELYETKKTDVATRYTLGAMQQVDPEYTRVSVEEGNRVSSQLDAGLSVSVSFEYQGSVPLNTHIKSVSDIDLLVIHEGFFIYDTKGVKAPRYKGGYESLPTVRELRKECETVLTEAYPAAEVDVNGAISISLSGGSFRRKVDVVPANWYDTIAYQLYEHKHLREIYVLDKYTLEQRKNSPFIFMHQIHQKDKITQGGTKKVIRLLKNVKNDCYREIELSTYDITSLVWHMPNEKLNLSTESELGLLANVQKYLDLLCRNKEYTKGLDTPDGSRKIIDSDEKFEWLSELSFEVNEMTAAVYKEIFPIEFLFDQNLSRVTEKLMEARV